jgi:hypothetical protein
MNKEQFAIYEKTPQHGKDYNGVILAPFNTKEEAEIAGKKYGYYGDNYYADILDYNKKSKIINKEQQELLDEAYKKYQTETMFRTDDLISLKELDGMDMSTGEIKKVYRQYAPVEFINKCKTDTEFSEKWGLKIEERELSEDEGNEIRDMQYFKNNLYQALKGSDTKIDWENIPTKLIKITYKDKTIESYE